MKWLLFLCLILASCGTGFCFRVDGKYEDKEGGFEYCYEPSKGVLENVKTLQKAVIVTKEQLEMIKEESGQVEAKSSRKLIDILIERVK